jgi:hypothetical protein
MDAENQAEKTETTASPQEQQVAETQVVKDDTFNQDDVNRIVADRVARERAKFEKQYSGVDLDHYKNLVEAEEQRKKEELEKRGEYEKLLAEQAEKFTGKIKQYENELHSIKVDGTLLNEASSQKAVNPQQVTSLLKGQIKLNEAGAIDVVDANGQVRYDEMGKPIQVSQLVNEFLTANPHFVQAGPSGAGSSNGIGKQPVVDNDISKLDMTKPADRAQYAEIMKNRGIRV